MVSTTEKRASAGRVLIVPKGEYNPNATYEMLDLVNHNGYAWLAKKTVSGITPSTSHSEYWHSLLDIDKIVKEAISGTLADDVGDILEERFRDMLSEATYVTDLYADFAIPTFVKWDAETANTPYTSGLTPCTDGFAFVYGNATNHIISAWANGSAECYTHCVSEGVDKGWSKTISSLGGTMTGPLKLGGGKGSVSADDESTFLEAVKDSENYNRIEVTNPTSDAQLVNAAKLKVMKNGEENEYNLFGQHNSTLLKGLGYAQMVSYTYEGTGESNKKLNINLYGGKPMVPKLIVVMGGGRTLIALNGVTALTPFGNSSPIEMSWSGSTVSWSSGYSAEEALNKQGTAYSYLAIG